MGNFLPLFVVRDIENLCLSYVPRKQLQWWFVVASRNFKEHKQTICHLLNILTTIENNYLLDLFCNNCVDTLHMLYELHKFNCHTFVSQTWISIFINNAATLDVRLFCWMFVPHGILFANMHTIPLHHFEALLVKMDQKEQQTLFAMLCKNGHEEYVTTCMRMYHTTLNYDDVLVQLFYFDAPRLTIINTLVQHHRSTWTIGMLQQQCRLNIQRFFAHDVEFMKCIDNMGIVEEQYRKLYLFRAIKHNSYAHIKYFWEPDIDLEIYFPTSKCETFDNDKWSDIKNEQSIDINTILSMSIITPHDRVFKTLTLHIRIPEDIVPKNNNQTLEHYLGCMFVRLYKNIDDQQKLKLFSKSCSTALHALAQYIWMTSSSTLHKQMTPMLIENITSCDDDNFFEFAWSICSAMLIKNRCKLAVRALRNDNFMFWQFMYRHGLLSADTIFNPSYTIWTHLCKHDLKYLKTVWQCTKPWMDNYELLVTSALNQHNINIPRDVLVFISLLAVPLTQSFLLNHMDQFIHLNLVGFVRKIDNVRGSFRPNLRIYLQRTIGQDQVSMFNELVRLEPLCTDDIQANNYMLLQLALNSTRVEFLQFFLTNNLVSSRELSQHLLQTDYICSKRILTVLNYDIDFDDISYIPDWWN